MAARDRDGAARGGLGSAGRRPKAREAPWLIEEIESLAARARLQLGEKAPAPAAAASGTATRPTTRSASPRAESADVLALVAAGATNREVGERLHMAEKTASVHVSRSSRS